QRRYERAERPHRHQFEGAVRAARARRAELLRIQDLEIEAAPEGRRRSHCAQENRPEEESILAGGDRRRQDLGKTRPHHQRAAAVLHFEGAAALRNRRKRREEEPGEWLPRHAQGAEQPRRGQRELATNSFTAALLTEKNF